MSRFKNKERVQVIAQGSSYRFRFGTVTNTSRESAGVLVDGMKRELRFWDTELVPAPYSVNPQSDFTQTKKYIQELDEDTKVLFDAADIYPQGTSLRKDLEAFANHQAKIVGKLKGVLLQDGINLWEDEDGGK